jgi:nucleoside-diphosphate-sugar epimerase
VARIIGVGHRPPRAVSAKLELRLTDLRDPQLSRLIGHPHAVVHLGAVPPRADAGQRFAIATDGTRNLIAAAVEAGAGVYVQMSTAMAYGARSDNPVPLTEDAPLRAEPDFAPGYHAKLAEQLVQAAASRHPDLRTVVLRPAPVLGQNEESPFLRHLEAPLLALVADHDPPVQFCDAEDLARAIHMAVTEGSRMAGVFNVASDGWLTAAEVSRLLGRPRYHLPEAIACALADLLAEVGLLEAGTSWVHYLMYPWVVDTRALKDHGWAAASSNRDLVRAFAEERHDIWRVGPVRLSRRRLVLTAGAASVVWSMTAAALAWYAWARWGRDRYRRWRGRGASRRGGNG